MLNNDCIVKTAKDDAGNILWQAIYVNNKKEVENNQIDVENAMKYFSPNNNWKEFIFIENDIHLHFPYTDDFIYLLDFTEIEIGKIVYLPIGKCIVSKIWNDYRIAGEFEFWHWEDIDDKWYGTKYKQNLSGHEVSKFNIEGSDEVFVWEDWYYHQSFLYINLYQ